jgi:hypothetical protein
MGSNGDFNLKLEALLKTLVDRVLSLAACGLMVCFQVPSS